MDFMKVFDQTVREIKREVNLKVLKVPEIEQKVLDATDNEPWGPHGTALAEIAQATKKFSECQMVMNVLWTRLGETGKDWRFVYKALAVVEYLISNGSERAVDEIIEHTFQISSLTSFEYVEPSGKDMGINVRKKAETIVALLNNKDKIEEVRNKAMANRDKYVGLSSTGITYKSGTTSFGGSFQSRTRSYDKDRDYSGEEKAGYDPYGKSHKASRRDEEGYTSKKSFSRKDQERTSSTLKSSSKDNDSDKYTSVTSQVSGAPSNENDDFDDFDPRGTSSKGTKQVDLFGQDLLGDFMDAPVPVPAESHSASNNTSSEVDLFADATFVSASTQENGATGSQTKEEVDLFASSAPTAPVTSAPQMVDLFASHDPIVQSDVKPSKPESTNTMNVVDPFASVPLNNLEGSDPFGDFTSHLGSTSADAPKPATDGKTNNLSVLSAADSKSPQKKNTFQVKSRIWADTLSRGLIDLNIAAPKKVSLVDVGVVGGLSDFSDEKDKKGPPAAFYMGQAMGTGSGLSRTGYAAPPQSTGGLSDDFFSSLSGPQYQFGSFKK